MAIRILTIVTLLLGALIWLYLLGKEFFYSRKKEKELLSGLSRDLYILRAELDFFKSEIEEIKKKID